MFLKFLTCIPNLANFYIALKCDSTLDKRTHNLPSVSELATILVDNDSNNVISTPHIRIYTHWDHIQLDIITMIVTIHYNILCCFLVKKMGGIQKLLRTAHFFSQSLYV